MLRSDHISMRSNHYHHESSLSILLQWNKKTVNKIATTGSGLIILCEYEIPGTFNTTETTNLLYYLNKQYGNKEAPI